MVSGKRGVRLRWLVAVALLLAVVVVYARCDDAVALPGLERVGVADANSDTALAIGDARRDERASDEYADAARAVVAADGAILAHVAFADGAPCDRAVVEAQGVGSVMHVADVDARGVARIVVPKGVFIVRVRPETLAPQVLGPIENNTYGHGQRVEVAAGAEIAVEVRVVRAGSAHGFLVDPSGAPLVGAFVRLEGRGPDLQQVDFDATTDSRGGYAFASVRPGDYAVLAIAEIAGAMLSPLSRAHTIVAGQDLPIETMQVGGGPCRVDGRIVDQDGAAVADLAVVCYPQDHHGLGFSALVGKAKTGADGRFRIDGLPQVPVIVQPDPEGNMPIHKWNHFRLAKPAAAYPVALTQPGSRDIGDLQVRLSRPYVVALQLRVDAARWQALTKRPFRDDRVEVFAVDASKLGRAEAMVRLEFRDGRSEFGCETPHEAVVLVVRARGLPERVLQLTPRPRVSESLTIDLP